MKTINSPITGKPMKLITEKRIIKDREIDFKCYLCEDSGKKFTTIELDEENYKPFFKAIWNIYD